jgi:hypothetical protein
MVAGEGQRRALHERLVEVFGVDVADVLMEHLPPGGWGDVARRSDVDHVEHLLHMEMASMETRLTSSMNALGSELRGEMAELRGEMAELRGEMAELRGEMGDLRGGLRGEMAKQTRTVIVGMATMTVSVLGALVAMLVAMPR